jgi:hypothetical protein
MSVGNKFNHLKLSYKESSFTMFLEKTEKRQENEGNDEEFN